MFLDEIFMKRALQIAKNGEASAKPNPSVGAVIVINDNIIAEGFTSPYGGPHAEVNAIEAVNDKTCLKEATIYVTLEPCSHFGKTPPCADLIVRYQFKRAVVGTLDSNALVAGKGIKRLRDAGVDVKLGVLESECRLLHKRFFTNIEKKRPYIILKWAQTRDGFIAPEIRENRTPVWISNPISQQLVHKFRSKEHAILVGTNTVLEDNPKLNVRTWSGKDPIRVVLDRQLRIPKGVNVFDGSIKTILLTSHEHMSNINGQNLIVAPINFDDSIAPQIINVLYQYKISSLIIEGGTQLLQSFIDEHLWDEAFVFVGNSIFNTGVLAPKFTAKPIRTDQIKDDVLTKYKND